MAVFEKIMPDFKDFDQLLHQMDTNHDGLIQYEEFVVWICGTGSDRSSISAAKVDSQFLSAAPLESKVLHSGLLHAHADSAHQKAWGWPWV